ncbi:MAG TPA: hypothetical protein VIA62_07645 [Thermoanaerobaculia bacterium]|jgi:hypothetical protein|nr:hypothetical protein [Thermoanaerobaculia bacterium]
MHHHHSQGRFGRILGAMVLTAVLFLAAPTGAGAAGRTGAAGMWRWFEGLWEGGIGAMIRDWTAAAPAASPAPVIRAQDTVCPPAGCPVPVGTPGPGTTGQGGGVDPDGRTH